MKHYTTDCYSPTVRVVIKVALKGDAPLSIPIDDADMRMVGHAIGTFVV